MLLNKAYYTFKFLVPRRLQIQLRRYYVSRKRSLHAEKWPIDHNAGKPLGMWGHDPGEYGDTMRHHVPIFLSHVSRFPGAWRHWDRWARYLHMMIVSD